MAQDALHQGALFRNGSHHVKTVCAVSVSDPGNIMQIQIGHSRGNRFPTAV
jgi:hypothetical protein